MYRNAPPTRYHPFTTITGDGGIGYSDIHPASFRDSSFVADAIATDARAHPQPFRRPKCDA